MLGSPSQAWRRSQSPKRKRGTLEFWPGGRAAPHPLRRVMPRWHQVVELPCPMLILLAHGSREPRWRASVEKLAEAVRVDLGRDDVRLAYLGCPPTLPEVVSEAARAGVKSIRVLPLFLTGEGHVTRDVHPLIEHLRSTYGGMEMELMPAIGDHRLFRELLCQIAAAPAERDARRPG